MFFSRIEEIDQFIDELRDFYIYSNTAELKNNNFLNHLGGEEVIYLNENLNLEELIGCPDKYVLNEIIKDKTKDRFTFFVLLARKIEFEVNHLDQTKSTIFIELAKRIFFDDVWGSYLIDALFQRGYRIKEEDELFINSIYKNGLVKNINDFQNWSMLRYAVILKESGKFQKALIYQKEINTILSFKKKKPIGFNFPNLLGVAINAIQNYRANGDIILKAMTVFKVEHEIYNLDKKNNTFKKKKEEYLRNRHLQDGKFKEIANQLFPELETF